jgi:hypothetical protein
LFFVSAANDRNQHGHLQATFQAYQQLDAAAGLLLQIDLQAPSLPGLLQASAP